MVEQRKRAKEDMPAKIDRADRKKDSSSLDPAKKKDVGPWRKKKKLQHSCKARIHF